MNDEKPISNCSVAIVVPATSLAMAEQLAEQLGKLSDGDTFSDFFSVPLSASGQLPATHYGCHTHCRPSVIERLPAVAAYIPLSKYQVTRLEKVETGKTFDTLIESMGLQKIEVIV